jgi:hypothetical protein
MATQHINLIPRSRLPNLLTKYAPRGIRNQGRPMKRLLDEQDWNRPAMAYFPESSGSILFRDQSQFLVNMVLHLIRRHPVVVQIQYVYLISRHHCSFYYHYMFWSLLDHLQVMFIYQHYKNYICVAYITCLWLSKWTWLKLHKHFYNLNTKY